MPPTWSSSVFLLLQVSDHLVRVWAVGVPDDRERKYYVLFDFSKLLQTWVIVSVHAWVDWLSLPVRYVCPQLRVPQHHLLVAVGNYNLLTCGPAGTQSGSFLQIYKETGTLSSTSSNLFNQISGLQKDIDLYYLPVRGKVFLQTRVW